MDPKLPDASPHHSTIRLNLKNRRFEVTIETQMQAPGQERYENDLILALARFGYSPYLSSEGNAVCFSLDGEHLMETTF